MTSAKPSSSSSSALLFQYVYKRLLIRNPMGGCGFFRALISAM